MGVDLKGRGKIPVACGECEFDCDGTLTLVDRWVTDYPPIPYRGPIIEVYLDGDDPESRTHECPVCGAYLDKESCIERNDVNAV